MDKVLVEIFVPVANMSYDVFIPQTSLMSEVLSLVVDSITSLSQGKFKGDETSVLCDAQTGSIFNINLSIYELGIKNGSRLMLI
ncbi:MAG: methyltransferase [Clostridia bacterium]|nr:methyltransferase [Clostridia bacterium]